MGGSGKKDVTFLSGRYSGGGQDVARDSKSAADSGCGVLRGGRDSRMRQRDGQ